MRYNVTGNFSHVRPVAAEGITDFEPYRVDPNAPLAPDFFVPDDSPPPPGVRIGEIGPSTGRT
jgi:hypothetical protein